LFLPDTLFLLMVAMQVWFFLRFIRNGFGLNLVAAVVFAGLGALIRPVNALWIFPCIGVLFFCRKVPVYLRVNYMFIALLLFGAILLPRMWSSYAHGLGFRIDSISSEALMKNTSRLESSLRNIPRHKVLQQYRAALAERFAKDPEKFRTLGAGLRERDSMMFAKLLEHPAAALASHFNLRTLGPDLTGYFIRFQCSTLQSRKITGVVLDMFNKLWLLVLLLGIVWYFLAQSLLPFRMKMLLFLALGGYYMLMPGAVADSRYLLPALPFLCIASSFGLTYLYSLVREQKQQGIF
jgi:ABC-type multidrug transport system fused ATPase/permease subunit